MENLAQLGTGQGAKVSYRLERRDDAPEVGGEVPRIARCLWMVVRDYSTRSTWRPLVRVWGLGIDGSFLARLTLLF